MTFVTVEGYRLPADQAEKFLTDREQVARQMTALLATRYARVCCATLHPEDGPGLAAYDAAGEPAFFFPLDPGHVACAMQAKDRLEDFLADCL